MAFPVDCCLVFRLPGDTFARSSNQNEVSCGQHDYLLGFTDFLDRDAFNNAFTHLFISWQQTLRGIFAFQMIFLHFHVNNQAPPSLYFHSLLSSPKFLIHVSLENPLKYLYFLYLIEGVVISAQCTTSY